MGIPGYDNWATSGCTYRCACGMPWTDSDGGPCHETCKYCGGLIESEELTPEGLCPMCDQLKCKNCGEFVEPEDITDKICAVCREDVQRVREASNKELPLLLNSLRGSLVQEMLRKRLKGVEV